MPVTCYLISKTLGELRTWDACIYAIYKYITNTHLGIRPKIKFLNCSLSILNINDDKLEFIIGNETYVN